MIGYLVGMLVGGPVWLGLAALLPREAALYRRANGHTIDFTDLSRQERAR